MINPYGDNFIPAIPTNGAIHTPEKPFCAETDCPCHENDTESLALVQQAYQDGLITADHATDIVMGRMPW